jgi:threonylcarbamoyladenosine tRNA methylthiotransferase MtaB
LNQAEIEKFASQFHAQGHEIVASPEVADLVVINTSSVTSEAASDSRQKIRQAAKAGCQRIIPVGCLSSLEGDELRGLQGVDLVIPNSEKDHLVRQILGEGFSQQPVISRERVQGSRSRVRAFIKVQEGCDQHCTYCITRFAREKSRSTPLGDVIADIQAAERSGAKEAVLSGVQLGSWGKDLFPARDIAWLIQHILDETSIPRLRLSSIEPWGLPETFFDLWQNERLCPQLHLPLQSGSQGTLKRMGRINSIGSYHLIANRIRENNPAIALTTDIIVGFPGETDKEFQESLDFVDEISFAGGHVFHFSLREGTPASRFPGQVETTVKKTRSLVMRTHLAESGNNYRRGFLGKDLEVLWEQAIPNGEGRWRLSGLSGNYLRVKSLSFSPMINEISAVHIEKLESGSVTGRIIA